MPMSLSSNPTTHEPEDRSPADKIPEGKDDLRDDPGIESQYGDEDEERGGVHQYRSVSRTAVAAFIMTIVALLAFNTPVFVFLPLTSLVLALLARSAIARYPDELVGRLPANIATIGSIAILVTSVGIHVYIYATEVPDGYTRTTWRELQPDHPRKPISDRSLELIDKPIFIKGYVYPNEEQTNLTAFVLVRDKGTCCFGGQPKATDMVYVKLEGDLRINYSWRLRKLGGIFTIDELAAQRVGKLKTIGYYRLTADYLK